MNNAAEALLTMINLKQKMQKTFVNQLITSESIEIALNVRNQVAINKLYKLGNQSLQTMENSDISTYCVGLVVATILKELFEDESFVYLDNLTDIINKIQ